MYTNPVWLVTNADGSLTIQPTMSSPSDLRLTTFEEVVDFAEGLNRAHRAMLERVNSAPVRRQPPQALSLLDLDIEDLLP